MALNALDFYKKECLMATSYTDQKIGTNARKGTAGPLSHLKAKPFDKNKTTGKNGLTGLSAVKKKGK
jgi:hypothetical protein